MVDGDFVAEYRDGVIDGDFVAEYGDGDIEQGCGVMLGQKRIFVNCWLDKVVKVLAT